MARKLVLNRTLLAKYENGTLRQPPERVMRKLLELYGCRPKLSEAILAATFGGYPLLEAQDDFPAINHLENIVVAACEEDGSLAVPATSLAIPVRYHATKVAVHPATMVAYAAAGGELTVDAVAGALGVRSTGGSWFLIDHRRACPAPAVGVGCIPGILVFSFVPTHVLTASAHAGRLKEFEESFAELERTASAAPETDSILSRLRSLPGFHYLADFINTSQPKSRTIHSHSL